MLPDPLVSKEVTVPKQKMTAVAVVFMTLLFISSIVGKPDKKMDVVSAQSSKVCKECHVEIYGFWKNDLHAMSLDDPIFKASYMEAYLGSPAEAKASCLPCHAPVTWMNGDFDMKDELTKEGVSCDFCHSLQAVHLERWDKRFEFDGTNTKRGPLSNTSSPAHKTQASSLFNSSELCAGCHEYVNDRKTVILGTYSEWKGSPYAEEGVTCQKCHMPSIEGNVVDPKIKTASTKNINVHAISAAHSTKQLQKAARVEITKVAKINNFIYVEVAITNQGSGHYLPTGIPGRKLLLWAELKTPNESFSQNSTYTRLLIDQQGKPVTKMMDIFKNASAVALDSRLKPRETRSENFVFAVPASDKITITARLEYLFVADVLSPTEMRVEMARDSKVLK